VPDELELERYRPVDAAPFEYLWHDQAHWLYAYPDGKSILAGRDLDATVDAVDRVFPGEGHGYRRFSELWFRILEVLEFVDLGPPIPNGLAGIAARLAGADGLTQFLLGNPMDTVSRIFKTDEMRGMMAWWASQTASPPWQPGSSALACSLAPATHLTGKARTKGGSGALAATLSDMVIHQHHGRVLTGCRVTRVIVKEGQAQAVEWEDAESGQKESASAGIVLSSADARTLFRRLVAQEEVPAKLSAEVARIYYSACGLCKADVLVSRKPDFSASCGNSPTGDNDDLAIATGIIAPAYEGYVKPGWIDILSGNPARKPSLWCVAATALDPTLAPEGYHTLWLSQFAPKQLSGGRRWDDVRDEVGKSMFRTYAGYAGLAESDIVDMVVTTPDDMADTVLSVDPFGVGMNIDQMLSFRPSPSLSRYRTPIRGLYLTGSGTHPGGGITGMPGRNAALEALADIGRSGRSPRRGPLQSIREGLHAFGKLRKLDTT